MQTSWTLRIAPERSTIDVRRRRFVSPGSTRYSRSAPSIADEREVRVEVRPLALVGGAVGEHEQLGAVEHLLRGLVLEALERALDGLRLEAGDVDHRARGRGTPPRGPRAGRSCAPSRPRGRPRRDSGAMPSWPPRMIGKAVSIVRRLAPGRSIEGPRAEHRAAGEVLDLALAVDRRVGDDRDRLLEVVGEVLALGRERRERAVVAERADRLGAVRGHLLDELHVLALPAQAGEHAVLDLHRLGRAGGVVAGDLRALERAAGGDRLLEAGDALGAGALEPALADQPLHLLVVVEPRAAARA